jgi:hypothetical protein
MIPNVHTVPVQSSLALTGPERIVVNPNFQSETQQNVTLVLGKDNSIVVNVTVSTESGALSLIRFKLFTQAEFGTCMREASPSGCLVDEDVSNQTIRVPLNASTTYYFSFENRDASTSKTVLLSTSLVTSSVNSFVTRDGESNFVALGLGVIGLFVAVYGVAAKTVIPWE